MSEIIQGYNWVGESEKPDSTIHECSFKSLLKSFIINHNIHVIYILESGFLINKRLWNEHHAILIDYISWRFNVCTF